MYDTKQFFNDRAGVWDSKAINNPDIVRTMLQLSDIKSGSCILDVGCGTGYLEPFLLKFDPTLVLAIDFAENMIEVARTKFSNPIVEFTCADFYDITGLVFDNVFFLSTFPHLPEPERAVQHVLQLLKPGGRITISHSQGKSTDGLGILSPMLPAQGLLNLLRPYFRLDCMIDNNVMFMISGLKIENAN